MMNGEYSVRITISKNVAEMSMKILINVFHHPHNHQGIQLSSYSTLLKYLATIKMDISIPKRTLDHN